MKRFCFVFAQLLIANSVFAQDAFSDNQSFNSTTDFSSREISSSQELIRPWRSFRRNRWLGKGLGTFGLAAGPETFAAVKGTIQGRYAYCTQMPRTHYEFPVFGIHGGLEFSAFGMFAGWGSAGINAGINIGPVTLDGSLTFWVIGLHKKYKGATTYNPKVGLMIADVVWLKAGYSIFLRGENLAPNWMKMGNHNVNIELSFVQTL